MLNANVVPLPAVPRRFSAAVFFNGASEIGVTQGEDASFLCLEPLDL